MSFAPAYKIAWQSRRFWEQENNIYGGISWLANGPISLASGAVLANVWYPSDRLLSDQGVLIAGYAQDTGEFGRAAVDGRQVRCFTRRGREAASRTRDAN